jgi:multiple sugar transport system ATP-binding protein
VSLVETLGHEVLVHGQLGENLMTAKVDPRNKPEIDDEVDLLLELDHLHLFDAVSERRLTQGA